MTYSRSNLLCALGICRLDLDAVPASAVLSFGRASGALRVSVMNRRSNGDSSVREFFLSR